MSETKINIKDHDWRRIGEKYSSDWNCKRCGATSSGNSYIKRESKERPCPPKFTRESLNDIQIQALEITQRISPHYYEEDAIGTILERGEKYVQFLLNAKGIDDLVKSEEISEDIWIGQGQVSGEDSVKLGFYYDPSSNGELTFDVLKDFDSKLTKFRYTVDTIEINELDPHIDGDVESGFTAEIDDPKLIITLEPIKENQK